MNLLLDIKEKHFEDLKIHLTCLVLEPQERVVELKQVYLLVENDGEPIKFESGDRIEINILFSQSGTNREIFCIVNGKSYRCPTTPFINLINNGYVYVK